MKGLDVRTEQATGFAFSGRQKLLAMLGSGSTWQHGLTHPWPCSDVQVGVEKAKVNLENDAAQVEAEKCAVIAKDVTELQARCEKDLAAAEPLVAMAEAALDTLNKKDLGEFAHGWWWMPACVWPRYNSDCM